MHSHRTIPDKYLQTSISHEILANESLFSRIFFLRNLHVSIYGTEKGEVNICLYPPPSPPLPPPLRLMKQGRRRRRRLIHFFFVSLLRKEGGREEGLPNAIVVLLLLPFFPWGGNGGVETWGERGVRGKAPLDPLLVRLGERDSTNEKLKCPGSTCFS